MCNYQKVLSGLDREILMENFKMARDYFVAEKAKVKSDESEKIYNLVKNG